MNQIEKSRYFAELHVSGNPCVLYNIWDAGSAQAIENAGGKAIATGSWSVAAAQGFTDGQAIPLDLVEAIVARICTTVSLPVTVDAEGGYAEAPAAVAANVQRLIDAGAIGINFEDQIVGGSGLYAVDAQCIRIGAIREMAITSGIPLFINARTDLFLQASAEQPHPDLIDAAKQRAAAYREAGASGFFVPGLADESLIGELCEQIELPLNVMTKPAMPSIERLAQLGVARVSYGPGPYVKLMDTLTQQASESLGA